MKRLDGQPKAKPRRVNPRPCAHCGTVYTPCANGETRKYCSRACSDLARQRREQCVCKECGAEFEVKRSEIRKGGGKYCSRACWRKNSRFSDEHYARIADEMSASRRGAGNPAFKHGRDGERARRGRFNLALKGEKNCRNCGTANNLGLHHVIPRSMYRAGRDELLNGVPLCTWCHLGWHRRLVTLHRDIFTASEWEYLTSVSLLGQNIEAWLDDRYPVRPQEKAA